jgi:hypothetical protein
MNIAPDNTENAGIVEPYELPVDPEPLAVAAPDLSGYQYDIILTYKMIEDGDDQDTLFRIQFLQAFGITDDEYHPEIVSAIINDLYERYGHNPGIREIIESHPLYHAPGATATDAATTDAAATDATTPPESPSHHCALECDNGEMIFCMMFSFHLFDLFHKCLRHVKHDEEIPQALRDEMKECSQTLF